ncbi:unnamed protein product [Kuraishia capsulata CBS 1993]|uniref:Glutamate-1-semialdehyde 2,1-aminomutase n=1 Tax=Kuraishia capsulata CBS 1993 TaxID=1382522 RepID=W6MS62_9ASCO|nr:uncharacterized protein KUCA_T00004028001 [Kuraishia capsulata CBS 1993]CDK28047.1 unnamed protein product [Kuraishia capsulata CBS 1993]
MSPVQEATVNVSSALAAATERYIEANKKSQRSHLEAAENLPGGNTRSVLYNEPFPLFLAKGFGSQVEDLDGHVYTDMVGEMTAGLYGHSHPVIRKAIIDTFDQSGISLGGNNKYENELALEIKKRFPAVQKIRFCNSGSEANINLMVVAKAFTGKNKLVVFYGGYHGGQMSFGHGNPSTNIEHENFLLAEYNDIASFNSVIDSSDDIAAVLVEGMQGAGGAISANPEFLKNIETKCKEKNILFILDEVMTSRLSSGGLQKVYSLKPDLVSLGKYLGGGLTFGAFGGRSDILRLFDPSTGHAIPHSGTFNNNTLALAAGCAGLKKVLTLDAADKLNERGTQLRKSLQKACEGTKMTVTGYGSVMNFHFTTDGKFNSARDSDNDITELYHLLWFSMLQEGYWIALRGMVSLMVVLTEKEIIGFEDAVKSWIVKNRDLLVLD